MIHDSNVKNIALEVSEEEHLRCTKFLMSLEGKASYDYMDAMVLMPMAPKVHNFVSMPAISNANNRAYLGVEDTD